MRGTSVLIVLLAAIMFLAPSTPAELAAQPSLAPSSRPSNTFTLDVTLLGGSLGYARRISEHHFIGIEGGIDAGFLTYMIYAGRHFAEHNGWSYEEKDGFENKDLFEVFAGNLFIRHEYADWWLVDTGLRSSLFLHFDSSDDDPGGGLFAGVYVTPMFGTAHFKWGPRVQAGVFHEHRGEFGVFLEPIIVRIAFSW
jgi:hypothetical protein